MAPLQKHAILNFHGIGVIQRINEPGEEKVWVTEACFRDICAFAARRPDISLTFDDGNLSDYTVALPEMLRLGLRGAFFIIAGRIGTDNYLDKKHLQEMHDLGMTIGLHGMGHCSWRGLSEEDRKIEMVDARKNIEDIIGAPVAEAAFPFGAYDRKSLSILRLLKYEKVYTSDGGATNPARWLQHRISVLSDHDLTAIEKLIAYYYTSNAWALKRNLKSLVKRLR